MKNITKHTDTTTQEIYTIHLDEDHGEYASPFTWIDYVKENGRVIDSVVRDANGYNVDDPGLYERLQDEVDDYEDNQRR